jgi:hypothetical protein
MLEIGGWHPSWGDIHLGPHNVLQAHAWLGGGTLLPIHWGTFSLATHAWDYPVETLLSLTEGRNIPRLLPRLGQAVEPSAAPPPLPWWRTQAVRAGGRSEAPMPPPEEVAPRLRDLPSPLD